MRVLALETDLERLKQRLLSKGEQEIFTVRFHGLRFLLYFVVHVFLTAILLALCIAIVLAGVDGTWVLIFGLGIWVFFVLPRMVAAFLDWRFDVLILTRDKIIAVDQSSVIRVRIKQMNLENIAAVHAESQYLHIFPFGKICFDLKEGVGQSYCLSYIPDANTVSTQIAHAVSDFQKRKEYGYAVVAGAQGGVSAQK